MRFSGRTSRILLILVSLSLAFAAPISSLTIGGVAKQIELVFPPVIKMLVAFGYISGLGFGLAAIFKFKQVKDNPTQIPVSTPFALLATSALLVFLPGIFEPIGDTIFGEGADPGSPTGSSIIESLTG